MDKKADVTKVYNVMVYRTIRYNVEVEADSKEQAIERAKRLDLTEDSYLDNDDVIFDEEDHVYEIEGFTYKPDVFEHEEGWKYIA
jgi:hypothetical protein